MVRPIVDLQYYWVHANSMFWYYPPPPNKKILNKKHTNYVHVSISHLHKEPEILSLLKKATLHNNNKYIKKKRR